ncbi:conserved hypothetical protein [Lodderomyces elongisporus NRRL YB-4239]|uniref:RNA-directed DNA polymerase n=1 Tax=Lodderomyces elongisporus (strain ATCC 11503 / CBS 2605 / JCM 1781 / NBRC 1676 / NRRL YB-4239) TaxID=379508 RepID=A5DUY1_LODEL|nr:conserved hypothetical protein [Lodderomyces elongisporus NRRL YB-4239]
MTLPSVKGRECMALIDSGSGADLVLAEFVGGKIDSLPQDTCLCDVVVAFGASRQVTKRVLLEFSINGIHFSRWFMVVPGFSKDMVLGLGFVGEHENLISFKKRSFAGVSKENPLGLVDSEEFVEAVENAAEVGVFTLKTEEVGEELPRDPNGLFPDLIKDYKDIFLQELKETPVSRGKWDHRINVIPYVTAPSGKQYPLGKPEFAELKSQVKKMLDAGLIRQLGVGESDFNSPVLFVRKKDGSYRMCVDYRLLNLTVVQKQFQMPVVEQLIKEVSGYRYYSTLDMTQSFHQIRLDDETSHVTAFTAFGKKFAYNVLPFGFTNAPAILQETVSQLIQEIPGCVNYIDDIIVYSNSIEDHRKSLQMLFEAFRRNKFFFKGSKCELGVSRVTFLGHEVGMKGTRIPEAQLKAIAALKTPDNPKDMRSALGFFNYFRHYIENFSQVAAPLYEFATKRKVQFTKVHEEAFEKLRRKLLKSELLIKVNYDLKPVSFQLEVDASHHAIGAVLTQVHNQEVVGVIEMVSRSLTVAERNYPIRQKELLLIVFAVKKFRHYILGYETVVYTDHQSLETLFASNTRPESERIIRWLESLQECNLKVRYRSGEENVLADVLSRLVDAGKVEVDDLDATVNEVIESGETVTQVLRQRNVVDQIKASYDTDAYLSQILKLLQDTDRARNPIPPELKSAIKKYSLRDGVLYYNTQGGSKPVVGKSVAMLVLDKVHSFGHFGITKCYFAIQPYLFVPKLLEVVTDYVNSCDHCQRAKAIHGSVGGLMLPSDVPKDVFSTIHLDFVTGIPTTPEGYDCILVVVCALTKYCVCIPTRKKSKVIQTAKLLIDEVFSVFGVPDVIKSDKDIQFMNSIMKYVFEYYQIDFRTTSTNNPSTNGQVEALNKVVIQTIKSFCHREHALWSHYLKVVQFAINTNYAPAIRMTPYQAVFGRLPRDRTGILDINMQHSSMSAELLVRRAEAVHAQIKDTMSLSQDVMARKANRGKNPVRFEVGDMILLHREAYWRPGKYRKLTDVYHGPFRLVKKINDNAFEVDLPSMNKKDRVINVKYFRKYIEQRGVFKEPPVNLVEAEARVKELSAILGYDAENFEFDVTWVGCRPGHGSTVPIAWFYQKVPKGLRDTLIANAIDFLGDRFKDADADVEDPEEEV